MADQEINIPEPGSFEAEFPDDVEEMDDGQFEGENADDEDDGDFEDGEFDPEGYGQNIADGGDNGDGDDEDTDYDLKAKRMGWVNKDKYRGDSRDWVDAKEFVERSEREVPIMRERMNKSLDDVAFLKKELRQMRDTFKQFKDFQQKSDDRHYKKTYHDAEGQKRAAVENGDTEEYDRIVEEQRKYDEAFDKDYDDFEDDSDGDDDEDDPAEIARERQAEDEFNVWTSENRWFNDDPSLRKYAIHMSKYLQDEEGIGGVTLYNRVAQEVKGKFPSKFRNNSSGRRRNSGGGNRDGQRDNYSRRGGSKKTFGNLPAAARKQCMTFVKQIPGFTKEQYVRDYQW